MSGADIDIPPGGVCDPQQPHYALGGGHGPADGGPLPCRRLLPEGHIVEIEYLAGQLGGQGPPGKRALQQAQLPDQVQQPLAGLGSMQSSMTFPPIFTIQHYYNTILLSKLQQIKRFHFAKIIYWATFSAFFEHRRTAVQDPFPYGGALFPE